MKLYTDTELKIFQKNNTVFIYFLGFQFNTLGSSLLQEPYYC